MLRNPFFWVYLSGSAAGCSLGYLFRRLSKDRSGSTGFALFLSVSLLAFSTGIVLSPNFLASPLLFLLPFTGAFIIGFIVGRFSFAAVPPVLLIIGSIYLIAYLQIQSEAGIPVHEDALGVSVLRFTDNESVLELSHRGKAQLLSMESESFSVEAERIVFSPYLPLPRQEYLFALRLVPEAGQAVPLPNFQEVQKKILPLNLVETLTDALMNLGLWRKVFLRKGPLYIHLLRSYTLDPAFFGAEAGS